MATLLLSFGTPMIFAGDEFLHPQLGNNNPYCQDNVLTWLAWEAIDQQGREFTRFVRSLVRLRRKLKIFDKKHFFSGKHGPDGIKDLTWYNETGKEFVDADWYDGSRKSLSYCIHRRDRFILGIFNANDIRQAWKLPMLGKGLSWNLLLDTSDKFTAHKNVRSGAVVEIPAWSVLLFEIKK